MAKHVTPLMKAKRSGSIINLGSISSFIAQPAFVPYNTTKVTQLALLRWRPLLALKLTVVAYDRVPYCS